MTWLPPSGNYCLSMTILISVARCKNFWTARPSPQGDRLQVKTLNDFGDALNELEIHRFDLLILDVRLGPHSITPDEEAGITTLQAIRQRRFIPVVFYTGLPHLVRHLVTPLVQVVEKTAELPRLLDSLSSIFATRLPAVNRALIRHLETIQRDYMWDFVANHWEQFGDTSDHTSLAYLLARRLATSLSGSGIQQLAQELGDSTGTAVTEGHVHPMRYYVIPPVELAPLAGDIYQGQVGEHNGYWALLTPSCDMVTGREKADMVLLARCLPLTEQVEYQQWRAGLPAPSRTYQRQAAGATAEQPKGQYRKNKADSRIPSRPRPPTLCHPAPLVPAPGVGPPAPRCPPGTQVGLDGSWRGWGC